MTILNLPSRFENFKLNKRASYTSTELERLKAFIFQVEDSIKHIKRMIRTMKASNSGAFMILMGESGMGKTTFLNTLPLYIENLEVIPVYNSSVLTDVLESFDEINSYRIIVLENRETFETLSTNQLEKEIHAINHFIRSEKGRNSIVVWPCNGEEMTKEIIQFAGHVGGSSLFREDTILEYHGPSRNRFIPILKNTFAFFNEYDISDIGFTDDVLTEMLDAMNKRSTIGHFIENIRGEILKLNELIEDSKDYVGELFDLVICVVSGNKNNSDVEYLTKGDYSYVDIDRLFSATDANITKTLGNKKCICSMVSKEINCKVISIDYKDVLDILRLELQTNNDKIKEFDKYLLENTDLKLGKSNAQITLLKNNNLTRAIQGLTYKRTREKNDSAEKKVVFDKILELSKTNDALINRKLAMAMKEYKLVNVARTEDDFGHAFKIRSDINFSIPGNYVRVEMMWRENASAASISAYTLNKIQSYCRAMGIF